MRLLFLLLLVAYLIHAVVTNRRQPGRTPQHLSLTVLMMQAPLFLLSCYFGAQYGVFSRALISPLHIGLGLIGGHLIFGISLLITHRDLHDAAGHFLDLGALWRFFVETPSLLLRFAAVSITEEMIYRVAAQPLLIEWTNQPVLSIIVVAAAFSVVHWHFFRNPIVQSAEFVAFAVLLGALYYLTQSLSFVVVVHTLRNLEIVYLEYLIKVDELGDESAALQAVERSYMRQPTESS